jgi:flagellar basal-body rod protein FlgC
MAEIKQVGAAAQVIAASALRAQQARMRVIAENLANANSTARTPGGDPYRRQVPVFRPEKTDRSEFKVEYEPGHPSADAKGYVKTPNVDSLIEALDMREAQRAYEANLNVIETSRAMEMRTLDLLKR